MPLIPDPDEAQPGGGSRSAMLDQLAAAITAQLGAPEPQATQQYQPTRISPMQGFAMARNPQGAGQMFNAIQQPGIINYQQLVAQERAAKDSRAAAITQGMQLAGIQLSKDREVQNAREFVLEQQRKVLVDQEAKRHNLAMEKLGGMPGAGPTPPATVLQREGEGQATSASLDQLWNSYLKIHNIASRQTKPGQMIRAGLGESSYGGMLSPEYRSYDLDKRAALNAIVLKITGQAATDAQMQKYERLLPQPWDSPEIARQAIQNAKDQIERELAPARQQYPSTAPGPRIRRSNFDRLPPSEQQRAMAAGVQIIEGQ